MGRTKSMLMLWFVASTLGAAQAFRLLPAPAPTVASSALRPSSINGVRPLCAQVQSTGSCLLRLALVHTLICAPSVPVAASSLPLAPKSAEVLHEKTQAVEVFDEELAMLARQMFEAMYSEGGIGLAGLYTAPPLARSLAGPCT